MVQQGSILKVIDNSSVREIYCIRVLNKGPRPVGTQGDIIVGSVRKLRRVKESVLRSRKHLSGRTKGKAWKRGDVVKALIVRTIKQADRTKGLGAKGKNQTGIKLSFPKENSAVLLAANGKDPLGSRARGPISPTARSKGFTKVISLGTVLV